MVVALVGILTAVFFFTFFLDKTQLFTQVLRVLGLSGSRLQEVRPMIPAECTKVWEQSPPP